MKSKYIIPFIFFQFILTSAHSQFHVGFYFYPTLEIGSPVVKNLELQGKYFLPDNYHSSDLEISFLWRFKRGNSFRMAAGPGLATDFGNSLLLWPVIPLQLEFIPIRSYRRLAIISEITTEFELPKSFINMRLLIGVRFYFGEPSLKNNK